MVTGIEHIGIFSKDTERLKDWYIKLFGWKTVYDNGKGTYFLKAQDGSMVEFVKTEVDGGKPGDKASGIRHLALSVDDFESTVKQLTEAGVEVLTEAKVSEKGIGTMFFFDPDGNVLHLISRPEAL